jgi:hypothetical protein
MTRCDTIGTLIGGVAATALTGCGGSPRHTIRFRMTVEVQTPQGIKTGTSVMELSTALTGVNMPHLNATETRFSGEAVMVDLPSSMLFVLVGPTPSGDDIRGAVINTFAYPRRPEAAKLVALFKMFGRKESMGREVVMRAEDYPKLVLFRDIRDPKTVELVDPNDFAKSFGAGVRLRRIMLTVVDEQVTVGISKRLIWLGQNSMARLDMTRLDKARESGESVGDLTLPEKLEHWDFRKGTEK